MLADSWPLSVRGLSTGLGTIEVGLCRYNQSGVSNCHSQDWRSILAKNKDWVAFDVETERLHYEVRGGWDNPAGFGFTVGASVDCEGNERLYDSRRDDMNARDALARDLLTYDRIVSFNGKGFDNPVIAAGDDVVLAQLNERAWDMKLLIDAELGINPNGVGPQSHTYRSCCAGPGSA